MAEEIGSEEREAPVSSTRKPLVFISHDTRDAALAEAFSKLLSSVSAGVLKSFRSSDKKGNQGIEYGVEWYPEIMKKLDAASDVVCLLTPHSIGRPWILYEAGVAKGKLETPVHGVALGIPLQNASAGPFAQFQNSDDSEDALTQLVMQLVRRIPGSEPDRDVVKAQVTAFRTKALELTSENNEDALVNDDENNTSVAKLFEEVKVMFQDLPSRIEQRIDPDYSGESKRRRRASPKMIYEMTRIADKELNLGVGLLIAFGQVKGEYPWLYEMAIEAYRLISLKDEDALDALQRLDQALEMAFNHPFMRELRYGLKDRFLDSEIVIDLLHRSVSNARDRVMDARASGEPRTSSWTEERVEMLRRMWDSGLTATQIAEELGGVARNAVIGKAHRLGLPARPSPNRELE